MAATTAPGAEAALAARAGRRRGLGPFLAWGVVFADIGTSIYYVPGILFGQVGTHAALFVAMTLVVFILLTFKYAEVCLRYPEGGGVVTVGARAVHPFVGVLGGVFIQVDYFLTAAISALSAVIYLSVVAPAIGPLVVPLTVLALVLLGLLNWLGIRESATVSLAFATLGFASQLAVLAALAVHVGLARLLATLPLVLAGTPIGPLGLLTGYAGAFLAFSGLESISQLAPALATPRRRVIRPALALVVGSMALTSVPLTLWSTTLLQASKADPNQFISLLGGFAAGPWLQIEVAVTGALLLIFASNTAIIGNYHVFLALSRMRFFPALIERRNRLRGTPHWAILVATGVPIAILVVARGDVDLLGDLYAFGLLGAFSVTCLCLDIVRWRERRGGVRPPMVEVDGAAIDDDQPGRVGPVMFRLGVVTTVLVILAWGTNLVAKPLATEFGGGVSLIGLAIALGTYALQRRQGRALVFPAVLRGGRTIPLTPWRAVPRQRGAVLALLPPPGEALATVLDGVARSGRARPVVFVYPGAPLPPEARRLFEMVDPYLEDRPAQRAFAQADALGRRLGLQRRFVYIPSAVRPRGLRDVWATVQPEDTLLTPEDATALGGLPVDYVRVAGTEAAGIRHYLKQWKSA